jgi:hypothetical protein
MGAPTPAVAAPIEPTLPEDMDRVLLLRLYPDLDYDAARAKAIADGKATAAAGADLVASAQSDVIGGEPPPPPPPAPRTPEPHPHPRPDPDRK